MRTFIFVDSLVKIRREGGQDRSISIYRIRNNVPSFIGAVDYDTNSTTGPYGEVDTFLVQGACIPKSWSVGHRGSYGYYHENDNYQIIRVF